MILLFLHYLVAQILSGPPYNAKKIYNNKINANAWKTMYLADHQLMRTGKTRYSETMNFGCFYLHKIWAYFNQIKNF